MAKRNTIPIEILRQLLECNFDTGELFWKERPVEMFARGRHSQKHTADLWNKRFAGKQCFRTLSKGYFIGCIFGMHFKAHRVIWALHYGEWPPDQIDHENHMRAENLIPNFIPVTNAQNCKNKVLSQFSTSGVPGVHWFKRDQNWQAYINSDRKRIHLGYFDSKDDAISARKAAEIKYGFHPNHGS